MQQGERCAHGLSSIAGMACHVQAKHWEVSSARVMDGRGAKGSVPVKPKARVCKEHAVPPLHLTEWAGEAWARGRHDEGTPSCTTGSSRLPCGGCSHFIMGRSGLRRAREKRGTLPDSAGCARALTRSWPTSSLSSCGMHLDRPLLPARQTPRLLPPSRSVYAACVGQGMRPTQVPIGRRPRSTHATNGQGRARRVWSAHGPDSTARRAVMENQCAAVMRS